MIRLVKLPLGNGSMTPPKPVLRVHPLGRIGRRRIRPSGVPSESAWEESVVVKQRLACLLRIRPDARGFAGLEELDVDFVWVAADRAVFHVLLFAAG